MTEEPNPPAPFPKKEGGAGLTAASIASQPGKASSQPSKTVAFPRKEESDDQPAVPNPSPLVGGVGDGSSKAKRLVSNIVRGQRVEEAKQSRVKELRREMTPEERALWARVRKNGLGYHFRRQQVIRGFIADFYCHQAALVVELDGSVHDDRGEYDAQRTEVFRFFGIEVLRFRNDEVTGRLKNVLAQITLKCRERVALTEEPNPPAPFPKREEGVKPAEVLSPSPLGGGVGEGASPSNPSPLERKAEAPA